MNEVYKSHLDKIIQLQKKIHNFQNENTQLSEYQRVEDCHEIDIPLNMNSWRKILSSNMVKSKITLLQDLLSKNDIENLLVYNFIHEVAEEEWSFILENLSLFMKLFNKLFNKRGYTQIAFPHAFVMTYKIKNETIQKEYITDYGSCVYFNGNTLELEQHIFNKKSQPVGLLETFILIRRQYFAH